MRNDDLLPGFLEDTDRATWQRRAEKLVDVMVAAATCANMPKLALRCHQSKQGIVDILLTGSGRDA